MKKRDLLGASLAAVVLFAALALVSCSSAARR